MQLIIISGRSGSGKSVALRVLEDLGYYAVDNIPVNLLPSLVRSVSDNYDKIAEIRGHVLVTCPRISAGQ